jgi:hypothetical protein
MRQNIAAYQRLSADGKHCSGTKSPLAGRKRPADAAPGIIARQRDSVPPPAIRVTAHFFILSRPIKSRLPSGTPLVRRMS